MQRRNFRSPGNLAILVLAFLPFLVGCGKPSGTSSKNSMPPEPPKPTFTIYYESEGLPGDWAKQWAEERQFEIRQIHIDTPEFKPETADLYILSPTLFEKITSEISFAKLPSTLPLTEINPAFTNHPFDFDNAISRPWRWTPFFFLTKPEQDGARPSIKNWLHWDHAGLPDDTTLLAALRLKEKGISANPIDPALREKQQAELTPVVQERMHPFSETWQHFQKGQDDMALLPLSLLISNRNAIPPGTRIETPAHGTIIHLDHLLVPETSQHHKEAVDLIETLLGEEKQKALMLTTGYFPVRSKFGEEIPTPPLVMPAGDWFNRSELLIVKAPPHPEEPQPQPILTSQADTSSYLLRPEFLAHPQPLKWDESFLEE